jgi:hypothetical protein
MKGIPNRLFEKGKENNPVIRTKGLVVARTFSPRGYANIRGEKEVASLPEIILCKANKEAPIIINGMGIIAKGPAPAYILQFNPMWGEKYEKGENVIYRFKDAFVPEEENETGHLAVIKHDLTSRCDDRDIPGEIGFSSIKERDTTLCGQDEELEMMIRAVGDSFPSKLYDIRHPVLVEKNKYYKIRISDEEMQKFVKGIACKIF